MTVTQTLLSDDDGAPLMTLRPLAVNLAALNIDKARHELENHLLHQGDRWSQTWGYFPELDPEPFDYPQSIQLAREVEDLMRRQHATPMPGVQLRLAFVRLAAGEPQSSFGGMHIDVHAGIGHTWPLDIDPQSHVVRLLFNVGCAPRRLAFCPLPVETLRSHHGLVVSRRQYTALDLPRDVPIEQVEIPSAQNGVMWCLQFVSSRIAHAGLTDAQGHFLVSFGGYQSDGFLATI